MSPYSSSVSIANQTINSFAPYTLTINPLNLSLNKKIRQIDYIWGDGSMDSQTFKPDPNINGDPKNYPKTKNFVSKNSKLSVYIITINIYLFGESKPSSFTINLNLQNPSLDQGINKLFNEVHLIKTRMFGADNQILYTFETQNPNNILMSLVKWKPIPKQQITASQLSRPYNLVSPFANKFNNTNPDIKNIDFQPNPVNPDSGTYITRTYP